MRYFYSDSSNKLLLDTVVYSKEINDNLKNTDVNKLVEPTLQPTLIIIILICSLNFMRS